jgi:uncharacterized protein (DUF2062 family)
MALDPRGLKVLLAIPTYNNRAALRAVAERALATGLPVLVADDGSTDGALGALKGLALESLRLGANQGKGAAILAAASWAGQHGYTHLLTLDGDGQHDPLEAQPLLDLAGAEPESIVVGRRDFARSAAPGSSRFGRQFSNFWVWACSGLWPADAQCGYRVYPVAALTRLPLKARRYDLEVEVLVRGAWAGLLLLHAPISVRYDAETRQASHFHALKDNARISATFSLLFTRNLVPLPHKVLFNPALHEARRLDLKQPLKSLARLLREAGSPREMAAAVAVGVLMGALPLPGLHMAASLWGATRLRLNRVVAVGSQNLCAPPFVPAAAFLLGYRLLHGAWFKAASLAEAWQLLGRELHLRLMEYALGALLLAWPLALAAGLLAWLLLALLSGLKPRKGAA